MVWFVIQGPEQILRGLCRLDSRVFALTAVRGAVLLRVSTGISPFLWSSFFYLWVTWMSACFGHGLDIDGGVSIRRAGLIKGSIFPSVPKTGQQSRAWEGVHPSRRELQAFGEPRFPRGHGLQRYMAEFKREKEIFQRFPSSIRFRA